MKTITLPDTKKIETLLSDVGAMQQGHFLLSSGLHSNKYIQCQKILQYPRYGALLADELVKMILSHGLKPQTVVGPALGAVHWELLVAQALDKALANNGAGHAPIRAIFAERPDATGAFEIRRGIEIDPDEEVLVVEDVTTTGGSAKKVVELIEKLGAKPIAVGTIVDRSGKDGLFPQPFFSLLKVDLGTFDPGQCPMCKAGEPVVKPGSSKK